MNLRPYSSVLIANRGEIAVRLLRACKEEGLRVIAVYSDADADALHVRLADQAVRLGPAPSSESYLLQDKVLEAARATGAEAIHPGYGFLSENAGFARRVLDAGLVWIGPPPSSIEAMGSKTMARQRMIAAGVPVVPGTADPLSDAAEARRIALEIGLPVMLKAAAGGGGKGMRRVDDVDRLDDALASAQSEATKSFGDDAVYVEKYVVNPRHVEIQVLADGHGNCVHLFERDCSIQRRHQKVVEEAPSPVLSEETRAAMGEVAVQAARAVGYVGAGTCEFLYAEDGSFYFLEMNTRLQVEHPITEMITGVDLARMQLRVARGETLPFAQTDLSIRGHAIECRIYAEDPYANFRPAPGPLFGYVEPVGPFVRVDSGAWEGGEVPIHYDPMIAKLVVWGSDRSEALSRLKRALDDYHIVGIDTSIPFFKALLEDEAFIAGRYTTGFLQGTWLESNMVKSEDDAEWAAIAAAIARATDDLELATQVEGAGQAVSPWKQTARWQHTTRGGLR